MIYINNYLSYLCIISFQYSGAVVSAVTLKQESSGLSVFPCSTRAFVGFLLVFQVPHTVQRYADYVNWLL